MPEGRRVRLRLKWEPRDIWVGIYWDRQEWWGGLTYPTPHREESAHREFHLYLTIIPMLPLHLSVKHCPRPDICQAGRCPIAQEKKESVDA